MPVLKIKTMNKFDIKEEREFQKRPVKITHDLVRPKGAQVYHDGCWYKIGHNQLAYYYNNGNWRVSCKSSALIASKIMEDEAGKLR